MGDNSTIEWTDATWNPTVGCSAVSPGCDHCYAERQTGTRLKNVPAYAGLTEGGKWTGEVRRLPDRFDQPLRWTRPRRIFVNSMSDLFHPEVGAATVAKVWDVMRACPQHTFQILTKRPQRMPGMLRSGVPGDPVPLANVWLGTSIESQAYAFRARHLLDTPAAIRFISAEPLLGPLDLTGPLHDGIDWVIVGGESGRGARPMHPAWARSLRDQCLAAGVPFLFKQWGEFGLLPRSGTSGGPHYAVADDGTVYAPGDLDYPNGLRRHEAIMAKHDRANLTAMYRVGKHTAGRELDGRTWDEYPVCDGA